MQPHDEELDALAENTIQRCWAWAESAYYARELVYLSIDAIEESRAILERSEPRRPLLGSH